MENYLPFILIIGSFVYKLYTNYKEEMQKAEQRKPHTPINTPPVPSSERKNVTNPFKKKDTVYTEPKIVKENYISMEEVPYDEVLAAQKRKIQVQSTTVRQELHTKVEVDQKPKIKFDLREAVIQAAILERPYK